MLSEQQDISTHRDKGVQEKGGGKHGNIHELTDLSQIVEGYVEFINLIVWKPISEGVSTTKLVSSRLCLASPS
jgi:hypothetical protein